MLDKWNYGWLGGLTHNLSNIEFKTDLDEWNITPRTMVDQGD